MSQPVTLHLQESLGLWLRNQAATELCPSLAISKDTCSSPVLSKLFSIIEKVPLFILWLTSHTFSEFSLGDSLIHNTCVPLNQSRLLFSTFSFPIKINFINSI
jgi:hypothetical protein